MRTLKEIVENYGTDKTLSGYTASYEQFFEPIRLKVKNILEVGVGSLDPNVESSFIGNKRLYEYYKQGGSLRTWRDYFSNANVYGIDIAEDCRITEDRIQTFIFDSSNKETCSEILKHLNFDIIIDDGNHDPKYQIKTLKNLFPLLNDNGFYVIEDIGGYSGTEELFVEYLEEFNNYVQGHIVHNRGNHVIIQKLAKVKELEKSDQAIKKDFTLVTGLWNIGRNGRDFEEHYLPNLENFLKIDAPMVVFVPHRYKAFVEERRQKDNTRIVVFELEHIKKLYEPFWDKTQKIRTDTAWLNITGEGGWLQGSPQATLEWYNPIVQSKMFLLHDASIWNYFDTKYFFWLDAGITNTVPTDLLVREKALDNITKHVDNFLFLSYPYESAGEIHGFDFNALNKYAGNKVEYVCRGGLFGGTGAAIRSANGLYYSLLDKTLTDGYMGTEESIFSIMSYVEPEKYRRYSLDGNGLVVKFIGDLINNNVQLEPLPVGKKSFIETCLSTDKLKTSLYMLTFNFPEQVRYTLEKYKQHPGFLDKTRKILIDNSNNEEAVKGNKQICEEYGFEHIITGENLGINRGRFKAAEHFDQSDSDYYIFLEDDMGIYAPNSKEFCRNGFRNFVPNLYEKIHKIMLKEKFDFLKLTFTEVFMDNHLQVSWYNVPQSIRTQIWPHYDKLPTHGLDFNCPRTVFNTIDVFDDLAYAQGEVYYANWPMIVGKEGNRKMFLDTIWANPFEQTWMSHMFQETRKGNLKPAVLLASPIEHNRIVYYKPEERREN